MLQVGVHAGEWQGEKSTEVSLSNRVKLETMIPSRLTVRSHVGSGAEIYTLCFQGFVSFVSAVAAAGAAHPHVFS